jgi:amino acid transporter
MNLKELLFGKSKDPLDTGVFHQISLAAFLAWVGLGADGLSSSAYGPEEAYLALGTHTFLALPLAILMALTVFIISASYNHVIELFPTGGGGYLAATKLLGPKTGLVAGCSLVVDYVLTITISVASGVDALFSFLPAWLHGSKLITELLLIFFLILLNLRGTKESVLFLLPIFLLFLITHVVAISLGILGNVGQLGEVTRETYQASLGDIRGLGLWPTLVLLLHAYSLGGGTYTGIEAVSNGLQVLREPKVQTAKRTMLYMAISLAFTASGILFCYLLFEVSHEPGKTLNATLFEKVYGHFFSAQSELTHSLVILTLVCEAALLFVAAQAGFIAGPRALSNMAIDSWVPHRLSHLSDHLVTRYGIWIMGLASTAFLIYTQGHVKLLVVMYSINVFLAFTLTQLGMCRHWWKTRKESSDWWRKFSVNGLGLLLTSTILVATVFFKFAEGGWVTVSITVAFIGLCYAIRYHYDKVNAALRYLDATLMDLPFQPDLNPVPEKQPNAPTAVLIVRAFEGIGIHSLLNIGQLFPNHFKNILFVSVGLIDSSQFKGVTEIENLRRKTEEDLKSYVEYANCLGWYAEYRYSLGVDLLEELQELCISVAKEFPKSVFFAGRLVFEEENLFTRVLHNHTPFTLQQKLQFEGLQMIVLPIRVFRPAVEASAA